MDTPTSLKDLVNGILDLINLAIPLIISVVLLILVWKILNAWVVNPADEKKREEGKQLALTAVLVMVIMLSVWGIVVLLQNSLFG